MTQMRARRGRNAPTINDVAVLAGVSPMTVSRVINAEHGVRDATRSRVQNAIAALDYSPSPSARRLAIGNELRIGLLCTNPSFAYLNAFLLGGLEEAARLNAHLLIERYQDVDDMAGAILRLPKGRIDGVILPPPLSDSAPILAALERSSMPVVAVATGSAPRWAMSVSIDDRRAADDMTSHIIKLGHRRIGFITGNANQTASTQRLAGYHAALHRHGVPADPLLVERGAFTYRSGLIAAEALLSRHNPPTAIFASNDDMAAATVAVAHRRGLDVPGDLTVCGFDDTAMATTIWPELTTIRQPIFEMSQKAVKMLVQAVRSAAPPADGQASHKIAAYELILRASDAPPR